MELVGSFRMSDVGIAFNVDNTLQQKSHFCIGGFTCHGPLAYPAQQFRHHPARP